MGGPGLFVSVEGIDGSGKSTQAARLAERLRAAGEPVRLVRDPGTTRLGERVRQLLLEPSGAGPEHPWAEVALFLAARVQLLGELVLPALERGETVVADRYIDSTLAYQGGGRGLDRGELLELHRLARADRLPDLTLLLDLSVEAARRRFAEHLPLDRMEAEPTPYHERVRRGYLELARAFPERIVVLAADAAPEAVTEACWEAVSGRLAARSAR